MKFLPPKIYNRFTKRAKDALKEAISIGVSPVMPFHLLYGIWKQEGSLGKNVLRAHKFKESDFYTISELKSKITKPAEKIEISSSLKNALKKAAYAASKYGHKYIATEHLLYGLAAEEERKSKMDRNAPLDPEEKNRRLFPTLKNHLEEILSSSSRFPDLTKLFGITNTINNVIRSKSDNIFPDHPHDNDKGYLHDKNQIPPPKEPILEKISQKQHPGSALEYFCEDLCQRAKNGKLDPLIGREKEVSRLIYILNRRTKNNPVLVGDPGVGKTAIVHGLAQRIIQGEVPENLSRKRILSLDLGLLIAGTIFRGEFEARLKDIIKEAQSKDVILFIDELHNIVGAGSAQGSMDAANILKPPLSRGELRIIGATTFDEYRKYIEKDGALERRFQSILVKEQSPDQAMEVLKGLKDVYEKHHNIEITDSALQSAVQLSERYISDRVLPDKALDIVDEAASRTRSEKAETQKVKEIKLREDKIMEIEREKEKAVEQGNYEKALAYKKEYEKIVTELESLKQRKNSTEKKLKIDEEDIKKVISDITGVPLQKIQKSEAKKLIDLEKLISKKIIGQKEAISLISNTLRRARAGLNIPKRPLGSFLFLGPTGVGKTELAKVLANELYAVNVKDQTRQNQSPLIKIDMSEFMEPHSVSRLIGAPAGYIGYEEGGNLTEAIRQNPYSIVLFDEIEKAHPQVYNILLQILEDGELTSAQGRRVNFKNSIIIMTSNLGTNDFTDSIDLGFMQNETKAKNDLEPSYEKIKTEALNTLKESMRPELINRIDQIIVFKPLGFNEIKKITSLQLNELSKRLKDQGINIKFEKNIIDKVARLSFNPKEGARLVRKTIQSSIEEPLAEKIISGKVKQGDSLPLRKVLSL